MRICIGLPSAVSPRDGRIVAAWAEAAEKEGFPTVAVIDRILAPTYDPLTTLAAAASVTREVELLTSIVLAPLRPATVLAGQAATVDRLSGGRLTLGLGVGSRQEDYEATGVPFNRRGRLMDQLLEDLSTYWAGASADVPGPQPVRPGGVPLLFGGNSQPMFDRTAHWGEGWINARGGATAFAKGAAQVRATWTAQQRSGKPRLLGAVNYALGDSAVSIRDNYMNEYYGTKNFVGEMIAETPASLTELREVIAAHEGAGCDDLVLLPCSDDIAQVKELAQLL